MTSFYKFNLFDCVLLLMPISLLSFGTYSEEANKNLKGPVKSVAEHYFYGSTLNIAGIDSFIDTENVVNYFYYFDKERKLIEERSVLGGTRCYYNKQGLRVEETIPTDEELLHWVKSVVYQYDSKGRLVSDTSFGTKGNIVAFCNYVYDSLGRNIEETIWRTDNTHEPYARIILQYGSDSNYTKRQRYFSDESYKELLKYNNQGFITDMTEYYGKDSLMLTTVRKYDKYNNVIEQNCYDTKGIFKPDLHYTSTYFYDGLGNWVKKIRYGYLRTTLCRREIEYY
jgi:YD repeat-containing protein